MGERASYAPGTFSWAGLLTSDADDAVGDGQVGSTALRDGKDVAALSTGEYDD
jgi:hypothetical protein